jgi:SAM-dependent methyltransferase
MPHTADRRMNSETATTFRDPAGHVSFEATSVRRQVRPAYAAFTRELLASPMLADWVRDGKVVPSTMVSEEPELVLEHPRLFFISYVWEWCPAQLRAAAALTLDLAADALANGYFLKDATPSNVIFDGPKPVFVDVLSFERREPTDALWLAQGQFVRTFLLPLLAQQALGWPLAATQLRRDGYEPSQIHAALSKWQRMQPKHFGAVTLPTWFERNAAGAGSPSGGSGKAPQLRKEPAVAQNILLQGIAKLRKQIAQAAPPLPRSHWSDYTATSTHYSAEDHAKKRAFVEQALAETQPKTVLDIGANTGTYSLLAAKSGAKVVALDTDAAAVERMWHFAEAERQDVLPLVADIARPTPALGWANAETFSLLDRLEGKFDLVLMLAVIHHLLLMDQVPLETIAALAARITRRYAVVEWVPQNDPMFQFLLRGRDALYEHLQLDNFLTAFEKVFAVRSRCELANGRTLVLFEKR